MGAGNGVFHPCDFAILNASVAPRRLGHAYSTHGVGGNLGYALAPIVSFGARQRVRLAHGARVHGRSPACSRWRRARTQRAHLTSHRAADAHAHTLRGSVGLFLQPAILLCFGYFVLQTAAGVGLQTFLPGGAQRRLGIPLVIATIGRHRVPARRHRRASSPAASSRRAPTRHDRVAAAGLLAARRCSHRSRTGGCCRSRWSIAGARAASASSSARPGPRAT